MTTVVNNPGGSSDSSGVGMIVGVILAIILIVLFFVYGLPALKNSGGNDGGINLNVDLPTGGNGGTGGGAATP